MENNTDNTKNTAKSSVFNLFHQLYKIPVKYG